MNRLLYIFVFFGCSFTCMGQSTFLSRQVISSGGSSGSGTYFLDYTIGQPEYITGISAGTALTQGFQQPSFKDELQVDWAIEQPGCSNNGLGTINVAALNGCGGAESEILVDGEPSSIPITGLPEGEYLITVSTGFNCMYEELIVLTEENGFCDLVFYNTITPNNDGINENWIIEEIEEYNNGENEVRIVNRWGLEVFKMKNYSSTGELWAGEDQEGKTLASGTYFYFVSIGDREFTGYIELLR